jgi:hypothetical protein
MGHNVLSGICACAEAASASVVVIAISETSLFMVPPFREPVHRGSPDGVPM